MLNWPAFSKRGEVPDIDRMAFSRTLISSSRRRKTSCSCLISASRETVERDGRFWRLLPRGDKRLVPLPKEDRDNCDNDSSCDNDTGL